MELLVKGVGHIEGSLVALLEKSIASVKKLWVKSLRKFSGQWFVF